MNEPVVNHSHSYSPLRESVLQHFLLHEEAKVPLAVLVTMRLFRYHEQHGCPLDGLDAIDLETLVRLAA